MQHILGATIAPVGGDPTGRGSGGSYVNVGTAPGPAYAWEGSVGDVKTDTGNKMTEIPLVADHYWAMGRYAKIPATK